MNEENHLVYFGSHLVHKTPIAVTGKDRRAHLFVIGSTGTGKSRLMENLFLQDVYAGLGAAFIDPHGTSAERVLDLIPSYRICDVVYFHPADLARPIGINILKDVHPDDVHLAAQGIVGTFKSRWRDSWGPRMERILYNAVAAILEQQDGTLLGVLRLLVDDAYRRRIVSHISDLVIRTYWEIEYPELQERLKQEAISPIQNKVERFLSNVVMRNTFGQKRSAIDFFDLMNSNKIFIANLSNIGEMNCNLAGSLLVTQFYLAAMRRIQLLPEAWTLYPLYADELHSFATETFGDILTQTRKFGLSFCGASQFLDQLDQVSDTLRSAVFGAGTLVAFRVGGEDASVLRKHFAPWPAEELADLDNTIALIKRLHHGERQEPFKIQTFETPPSLKIRHGQAPSIINYSRDNYGTPRAEIEAEISLWMQGIGQNASEATLKRVARTIAPKKAAKRRNRG